MSKEYVLLEQVIIPFHPIFSDKRYEALAEYALEHPQIFKVTRLVEETLAHVGGYDFVDGSHYDFSDGTECKTASVSSTVKRKTASVCNSFSAEISGVMTASGNFKSGAIRAVVYVPQKQGLRYYFFPPSTWEDMVNVHPTTGMGRLKATYNLQHDTINLWDPFRVSSFEELAKLPADYTLGELTETREKMNILAQLEEYVNQTPTDKLVELLKQIKSL